VGAAGIITNERKIETRVTVKDGETIVLGGLIRDNVLQRETRVPFLGSIPVLGQLFRSRSSTTEKTNLLVFIRPTIMRDDEALRGATGEKYNFIRERQLLQRESTSLLLDPDHLPLLPEWESTFPPNKVPVGDDVSLEKPDPATDPANRDQQQQQQQDVNQ